MAYHFKYLEFPRLSMGSFKKCKNAVAGKTLVLNLNLIYNMSVQLQNCLRIWFSNLLPSWLGTT